MTDYPTKTTYTNGIRDYVFESLGDAYVERLPEFINKWLDIGLCTDVTDRPRAEAGINLAYSTACLDPPKKIVWCGSPLSAGIKSAIVSSNCKGGPTKINHGIVRKISQVPLLEAQERIQDCFNRRISQREMLSGIERKGPHTVAESFRESIGRVVGGNVAGSVRTAIKGIVSEIDRERRKAKVKDLFWGSVDESPRLGGQHSAESLAYFDFFREALGMTEYTRPLEGLFEVARSANWWIPQKDICWVSERHCRLYLNGDGQLHNDNAPALMYPDGFSIWAINGVLVDDQIVLHPETQTVSCIDEEQNEEVRRIRIERFGWPRYLCAVGAIPIDARVNDVDGTEERLMQLVDGSKRLLCACRSTARVYAISVPRTIRTCELAQKWMAGGTSLVVKSGSCLGAS